MSDLLEQLLDMEKTLGEHPWGAVCADVRAEIARLQSVVDAAREVLADHAEREATYPGVSKLQLNRHRVMGLLDGAIRALDGEVKHE